jgi:hypothetical protein
LHDRLGRLFHRNRGCGCESDCCGAAAPALVPGAEQIAPPKEAPKKMPAGDKSGKQAQTLQPIPPSPYAPRVETETHSPFELNRRYESRVDHAPDYSWLTGQLFYVHADGGLWVLRYAPLWKEDPNGGSVVLARDLRMESYREGDLVTIHGEILNQRSSLFLGGPLYRAGSIQLVEHRTE